MTEQEIEQLSREAWDKLHKDNDGYRSAVVRNPETVWEYWLEGYKEGYNAAIEKKQ